MSCPLSDQPISAIALSEKAFLDGFLASSPVAMPLPDERERNIAAHLASWENRNQLAGELPNRRTSSAKLRADAKARLPEAWSLLEELLPVRSGFETDRYLAELLEGLEALSGQAMERRAALREYVASMQLYAMMPIYLSLDRRDPGLALQESIALAREAVSLVDLDRALGDELFEMLLEPPAVESPPSVALRNSLNINLGRIAECLEKRRCQPPETCSLSNLAQPSSERCAGYWSIVRQWIEGSSHLRIPPTLSIGAVLWPKLRDHWTRLSNAMLDGPDVETNLVDFVEIRSSSDPQLAESLAALLERCREEHASMALVVIQCLNGPVPSPQPMASTRLLGWQRVAIEQLRSATDGRTARGFICDSGELALVIEEMERYDATAMVRRTLDLASQPLEALSYMIETPKIPLVGGLACVASPSKRFQLDSLISAAWRCLDAARLQGSGAVKSLEVF